MPSNNEYIRRLLTSQAFHQGSYLLELMSALGYGSDAHGACNAFSIMGIQAFLSGDFKSFQERLALMMTEKDWLISTAKTLAAKLQSNTPMTQFNLTDHEKQAMELLPFFDNLEVVLNPDKYEEMLGKKISANNPYEVLPFVASDAIKELGGMVAMEGWPGLYKINEFRNYIDAFQQSVTQAGCDMAFQLLASRHAISIIYDVKKLQWTIIDADNLQTVFNPVEHSTLANLITDAFRIEKNANANDDENDEENYSLILATVPFSTGNNLETVQRWVSDFKNHPTFIAAHTITDKKATIVTVEGNTLAHLAASLGQAKIIDEIKAHGGDVEAIYAGRTVSMLLEEKQQNTVPNLPDEDLFINYITSVLGEDDELKLGTFVRKLDPDFVPAIIALFSLGGFTKYIKDTEDLKVLAFLNDDAEKNIQIDKFGIQNLVNLVKKEEDVYIIRDLLPESRKAEFFSALDAKNIAYTLDKPQKDQALLEDIVAGKNLDLSDYDVFGKLSSYSLFKLKTFINNVDSSTLQIIFYSKASILNTFANIPPFLMKDLIDKINPATIQQIRFSTFDKSDFQRFMSNLPVIVHSGFFEKMDSAKLAEQIRDNFLISSYVKDAKSSISADRMQALENVLTQEEFLAKVKTPDELLQILSVSSDAGKSIIVDKIGQQRLLELVNQTTQLSSLLDALPEPSREFIITNADKNLLIPYMLNFYNRLPITLKDLIFERFTAQEIISAAKFTSRLTNILMNLPPNCADNFLNELYVSIQNNSITDEGNFKTILEERHRDKPEMKVEDTTLPERSREESKSEKTAEVEAPAAENKATENKEVPESPVIDINEVTNLFKKIYSAILAGESRLYKYDFMRDKNNLSSDELIKKIAADTDHPDVKKAWDLTNKFFNQPIAQDKKTYDKLFSEIYLYAFERSGLFKRAKIDGQTFYDSKSLKSFLDKRYNGEVPEKADNKSNNRTAKINSILRR